MVTEIEAKEVKVAKLFSSDFIFEIPIYQRPLSWETDNFDILFEDIFDAINDNENQYFLGTIIIHEHENANNKYYIVDGQQRISALAILMAVIRDLPLTSQISNLSYRLNSYLYQEEDRFSQIPEEMRIIPWDDLRNIFKKYIYDFKGTINYKNDFENKLIEYSDEQDPKYHLYEAIDVFTEKLNERLTDTKQLERFVIYLLNQVSLVYIKTATLKSAFRLFNVLNTRGMPLNTSDLLKSENIGVIPDEVMRHKYANNWRDIENNLGRDELENIITFIRTIQIKEKAKFSIYEEYRRFIFEKELLTRGKVFIDYLSEVADIYLNKILEGKVIGQARKGNEYNNIANLLRRFIPFSDWIPPLVLFYYKFKEDRYLLQFILQLEKKVIIEWVSGFSYTERITSLNKILKLIEISDYPQKVIQELLFYKGEELPGRTARMLDFGNKNNIQSILLDKLNDMQFYSIYGGKLAKYILLRLDMQYWELENFTGYPGTITVEHILPQNPSKDSEWLRIFSAEEREQWTNRLGNLVLLSGRKNSQAQNYKYEDKKDIYFKGKSTPFRITQLLDKNEENQWNLNELTNRHQLLIDDAKKLFLNY
jgi:uncharacterized protein with ParB-like and HNH nuclease domain